jgi:hypothetical protein
MNCSRSAPNDNRGTPADRPTFTFNAFGTRRLHVITCSPGKRLICWSACTQRCHATDNVKVHQCDFESSKDVIACDQCSARQAGRRPYCRLRWQCLPAQWRDDYLPTTMVESVSRLMLKRRVPARVIFLNAHFYNCLQNSKRDTFLPIKTRNL